MLLLIAEIRFTLKNNVIFQCSMQWMLPKDIKICIELKATRYMPVTLHD